MALYVLGDSGTISILGIAPVRQLELFSIMMSESVACRHEDVTVAGWCVSGWACAWVGGVWGGRGGGGKEAREGWKMGLPTRSPRLVAAQWFCGKTGTMRWSSCMLHGAVTVLREGFLMKQLFDWNQRNSVTIQPRARYVYCATQRGAFEVLRPD